LTGSKSLGDVGFLLFLRVVSGDYGKPCIASKNKEEEQSTLNDFYSILFLKGTKSW